MHYRSSWKHENCWFVFTTATAAAAAAKMEEEVIIRLKPLSSEQEQSQGFHSSESGLQNYKSNESGGELPDLELPGKRIILADTWIGKVNT